MKNKFLKNLKTTKKIDNNVFREFDRKILKEDSDSKTREENFKIGEDLEYSVDSDRSNLEDLVEITKAKIFILEKEYKLGESSFSEKILVYKKEEIEKAKAELNKLLNSLEKLDTKEEKNIEEKSDNSDEEKTVEQISDELISSSTKEVELKEKESK